MSLEIDANPDQLRASKKLHQSIAKAEQKTNSRPLTSVKIDEIINIGTNEA